MARELAYGGWRSRMRPDALIFAGRQLLDGWSVMNRLGEITVPTLVMAGRKTSSFRPQPSELAAGIPGSELVLIDRAGHSPQDEQTAEVAEDPGDVPRRKGGAQAVASGYWGAPGKECRLRAD